MVSGGSAIYVLFYSIFYFFTKLEITEFVPTLLYFSYTGKPCEVALFTLIFVIFLQGLMVLTFWLLAGTIGFFATYAFVIKIYSAVKID